VCIEMSSLFVNDYNNFVVFTIVMLLISCHCWHC